METSAAVLRRYCVSSSSAGWLDGDGAALESFRGLTVDVLGNLDRIPTDVGGVSTTSEIEVWVEAAL